jgi:hypothetical protein
MSNTYKSKTPGMKKIKCLLLSLLVASCFLSGCKKEEHLNIILFNQPLEIIQKYIQGKWKLVYLREGYSGRTERFLDLPEVTFTSDNRYLFRNNSSPYSVDQVITWEKGIDSFVSRDTIWLMNVGISTSSIVKIYYDTLIYHNTIIDGYTHYLVRAK